MSNNFISYTDLLLEFNQFARGVFNLVHGEFDRPGDDNCLLRVMAMFRLAAPEGGVLERIMSDRSQQAQSVLDSICRMKRAED